MKLFIKKTLILFLIFFGLSQIPEFFVSDFYGDEAFSAKYEYYQKHREDFDCLFFGSSRLFRQLDTDTLSNLLAIKPYNFGTSATMSPENYYQYQKFLEKEKNKQLPQIAVLEILPFKKILRENINTPKNLYWLNKEYYKYSRSYILKDDRKNSIRKAKSLVKYSSSRFLHLFNLSKFKYALADADYYYGKTGYLPLEEDSVNKIKAKKRRENFLKDTSIIETRRKAGLKVCENCRINPVHKEKLYELINISKKKGIELFFVIAAGFEDFGEIRAVADALPKERVIDLSDPLKYPEFYVAENYFDRGHLNKTGGKLFTLAFAKDFSKKLKKIK